MPKKSNLTPEQRAQLVLRLLSKEEPAVQIARRAGVSEQTLYRWREEFVKGGQHALNGRGPESVHAEVVAELRSELAERDQVISELTIANRLISEPRHDSPFSRERGASLGGSAAL